MKFLKFIKHIFLFFLFLLLGIQNTYAKTELILSIKSISFSTELNQNFKSLEKELQPNIGFLKEECRFVIFEGVSAQKQHELLSVIQRNESIRNTILAHYTDWEIAKTNLGDLDDLTPTERALITKQEKVWESLGVVDDLANGVDYVRIGTKIDNKLKRIPIEKLFGNQAETFLNSNYVMAETLDDILTYRRFGGNAKLRGSYVSTSQKLTREELALVKEFNNSMRFEAIIKIPKGEKLAVGKVGPWPPKAPEFMGGADQIIISKYNYPENVWVQSIKDFKTGKIYTYGEFRLKFPNLCVN